MIEVFIMSYKMHNSPISGWVSCNAIKRKCRYLDSFEHIEAETPELLKQKLEEFIKKDNKIETSIEGKNDVSNNPATVKYYQKNIVIPSNSIPKIDKLLSDLNKKLERSGLDSKFVYIIKDSNEPIEIVNGIPMRKDTINVSIQCPNISYGHYDFVASLDEDNGSLLIKGNNLDTIDFEVPDSMVCEHCGIKRKRSKSYIIRDNDSQQYHQIGSSCVEGYLGFKPKGLWTLGYDPLEDENILKKYQLSSADNTNYSREQPVRETLALALALSDNGKKFRSKSSSGFSTHDELNQYINNDGILDGYDDIPALQEEYLKNGKVDEVLLLMKNFKSDNESYQHNINALANQDWVKSKNTGILVSALAIMRREELKKEKQALNKTYTSGYLGEVGEKIPKNTELEIVSHANYNYFNNYTGQDEMKSVFTTRSVDNHMVTFFTKYHEPDDIKQGMKIKISSATISKNTVYDDVHQTQLNRVRFKIDDKNYENKEKIKEILDTPIWQLSNYPGFDDTQQYNPEYLKNFRVNMLKEGYGKDILSLQQQLDNTKDAHKKQDLMNRLNNLKKQENDVLQRTIMEYDNYIQQVNDVEK